MRLPEDLHPLYNELNRRYFGGKLPRYHVEWSNRLVSTAGRAYLGAGRIRLSRIYHECYPDDVAETLAHEMVHVWLWHRGVPADHGPEFRAKLRELGIPAVHAKRIPSHFLAERGYARKRYLFGFQCPNCDWVYWSPVKSRFVHKLCFPRREMAFTRDLRGRRVARKNVVMRFIGRKAVER
ncbi:MAG: SprT-like domain-containing protein [Chloroflexi bacterium]|nr:SprT-like domain-containing protein [Chloroflexota bacterium]